MNDSAPSRGDLVWLTFDPQAGREQAGRRPALVLSHGDYNARVGLAIICPVTSRAKGYRFEVPVAVGDISGVILADQVRNLDWRARRSQLIAPAPVETVDAVARIIAALIGVDP